MLLLKTAQALHNVNPLLNMELSLVGMSNPMNPFSKTSKKETPLNMIVIHSSTGPGYVWECIDMRKKFRIDTWENLRMTIDMKLWKHSVVVL